MATTSRRKSDTSVPRQRSRSKHSAEPRSTQPKTAEPKNAERKDADRRRRPRTRRRKVPLWASLAVTFGALVMLAVGGALVALRSVVGTLEDSIQVVDVLDDAAKQPTESGKALEGAIDLLLLGIDTRSTQERDDARADTVLVVHIPATHDQAYLMSIPRDTRVTIPDAPNGMKSISDKINGAFTRGAMKGGGWAGGLALTARTVKNLTGIEFDGAAVIDFGGFKKVIETLGSVNLCVEADTRSSHYFVLKPGGKPTYVNGSGNDGLPVEKRLGINGKQYLHKKGCRDMQAWEALDFARIRKGAADNQGDYSRQRHQQQLIKAMMKKATTSGALTDIGKLNALLKAVGQSMLLSLKGITLVDFLFTMKDLAGSDLVLLKTNSGRYNSYKVNGQSFERLDDLTLEMFKAAKNDTLGQFTARYPEFVNNEK
ncbi:LCP family protein [Catellatospora sp. KI3]|uniref:LCP family protein n=1 Tax=Catellatospora sp. KI3 TaxID=3041620 RepID=UPI0024830870|nr:LCP family protein [Catellatospora sp. KI3]MDI1459804.1 LCP family protein [Catellatospora sp. KI3]